MNEGISMVNWAKDMFFFPRSLTGLGVTQTLGYLSQINPEIEIHSYPTNKRVFDWTIPQEWNITDAYIQHVATGKKYAEFSNNPLHVVGYSVPVRARVSLDNLKQKLHYTLDDPDAIPYVTSYYSANWGFCLSLNEYNSLPDGDYDVVIESELFDGNLVLGDALIRGDFQAEVFFSTYVCHPSMANNELSGPVLASALIKYIKESFPNPKWSYRFLFAPETIGSIAYLNDNLNHLKEKVVAGFVLSCVGDEREFSHIESRSGSTLADKALQASFISREKSKLYSFLERGSDERQYCAPGVDLPVAGFCRTKYGEYPEYHTSKDDFSVVTEEGLQGSFDLMKTIIECFEAGPYPKSIVLGEPQLGKRNLYPDLSKKGSFEEARLRMDLLAYSDGFHSFFDLSLKFKVPLADILSEFLILREAGLLVGNFCATNRQGIISSPY